MEEDEAMEVIYTLIQLCMCERSRSKHIDIPT